MICPRDLVELVRKCCLKGAHLDRNPIGDELTAVLIDGNVDFVKLAEELNRHYADFNEDSGPR